MKLRKASGYELTLIELINASEVQEDDEDFQSSRWI